MADVNITADPIILNLSIKNLFSSYPSVPRNADLDQTFYCNYTDVHNIEDAGIPVITITLEGIWLNKNFAGATSSDTLLGLAVTMHGIFSGGVIVDANTVITITLSIPTGDDDVILENLKSNWVAWSNIGQLNFTINKSNVAGERPFDWKGWCRTLKKHKGKVVAYGQNGVSVLTPSGVNYGMDTIHRIGTKGKNAVAGNEDIHFFIDKKGRLYSYDGNLEKLDYSEYLNSLTSDVVMSYDVESDLVYICDGVIGFVFSPYDKSLGAGPINITGIGSQDGTLYPVAPATITTPNFEICTDIYDLGSRNSKTIQSVEFGTDTDKTLYGAIDYRKEISAAFSSSPWKIVHGSGVLWQTAIGREFRFKLKTTEYEYLELDYIKVNGVIHEN